MSGVKSGSMARRLLYPEGVKAPVLGPLPHEIPLPLEVRVHGRGGQGGVTCAKPLGSAVAIRQTLSGKALLMCSCRTLGIFAIDFFLFRC